MMNFGHVLSIVTIFTVLLTFSQPCLAQQEDIRREVKGFGLTQKEAVTDALVEAVQQIKGMSLSAKDIARSNIAEATITVDDMQSTAEIAASQTKSAVATATKGVIQSYSILNMKKVEDGYGWEALLEVVVPVYKAPTPTNRKKIAIIPFHTPKKYYVFQGHKIPSWEISRQFTQKMVSEITQTRKFTVLDREYMEDFLREKNLILSPDAPMAEQAKIGQVLGVDYLILGTITDANIKRTKHTVPMVNEVTYRDSATFVADYRIMMMATRQIKWSDSVNLNLNSKELKKLVPSKAPELIQQAVLDKAAEIIAQKSMESIFPIRIAQVQGYGQFILNQGGTTVTSGDKLDVYKPGKKVIDRYTGESLGAAESWVATVQIVRVIPKMSYAKVVKGSVDAVQKGYICRRAAIADDISRTGGVSW